QSCAREVEAETAVNTAAEANKTSSFFPMIMISPGSYALTPAENVMEWQIPSIASADPPLKGLTEPGSDEHTTGASACNRAPVSRRRFPSRAKRKVTGARFVSLHAKKPCGVRLRAQHGYVMVTTGAVARRDEFDRYQPGSAGCRPRRAL